MLKKILDMSLKVAAGIFCFYLFLGFVVLPLGLSWVIRDQGTKFLKHPVQVRAVQFNPFLLQLNIYDLAVLDASGKTMAGFGRLGVDVSFVSLFKKVCHVEAVVLDGLQVNAVMSAGGHINLLDLVPAGPQPAAGGQVPAEKAATTAPQPLPVVIVSDILLKNGTLRFTDETIQPHFAVVLTGMTAHVTGLSTKSDSVASIRFETRLDEKGRILLDTALKPLAHPLELDTTLTLDNYALNVLTPYTGKYAGREVTDGKFEFKTTYRIADNRLKASHKILIQHFEFGRKVESKDALPLPFGLAVALLEDAQGRINISLPVTGDISKPDFHYWSLVGQVVRNFFMGLVTKPFSFLGSVLGADSGTDDLGYVRFLPGKADLEEPEKAKMATLLKGLAERPKLRLEVCGNFDPQMDWKAIKDDSLAREYADLRGRSSKSDSWVYQMIYQRHFGIQDLWAMTKKFRTKDGGYDDAALIVEIKRELIERAPADKAALDLLASARARVVYDFILSTGFDPGRITSGPNRETQGSMGYVPLEFILTVFDDPAAENAPAQERP